MKLKSQRLKPLPKTSWMVSVHEWFTCMPLDRVGLLCPNKMAVLEHPACENLDFQPGSVTSSKLRNYTSST